MLKLKELILLYEPYNLYKLKKYPLLLTHNIESRLTNEYNLTCCNKAFMINSMIFKFGSLAMIHTGTAKMFEISYVCNSKLHIIFEYIGEYNNITNCGLLSYIILKMLR